MSAVRGLARDLRHRFAEGWNALAPGAVRQFTITVAVGAALLVLLMLSLVRLGRRLVDSGGLAWESGFLRDLGADGPFSFSTGVWFQTFGSDPTLWILVLATAGIAVWMRRPLAAIAIVLAYLGPDLVTRLGWLSWDRARPDVLYDGFASPGFHSFPSGHTAKTLCVYGVLCLLWIRATSSGGERLLALGLLAFLAIVVPLGRLSMGVHWPSDILAGALLGLVWLIVLALALGWERRVAEPGSEPAGTAAG